jgi:hypothetical protein
MRARRHQTIAVLWLAVALALSGCSSPEDGRVRGGGPGGDGGNYSRGGLHVPSKLDGTKTWTARSRT